jgi:WD40 repeat protein
MEKISSCSCCKKESNNSIKFTCSHEVCENCIYIPVLKNLQGILYAKNLSEDKQIKCMECETGYVEKTNTQIISVLKNTLLINKYLCDEHNKEIELICMDCNKALCIECIQSHNENYEFKLTHKFSKKSKNPNENICEEHSETKNLYCINCNKKICNICEPIDHDGHKVEFLDEYKQQFITKINKMKPSAFADYTEFSNYLFGKETGFIDNWGSKMNSTIEVIDSVISTLETIKTNYIEKMNILLNEITTRNEMVKLVYQKLFDETNYTLNKLDISELKLLNEHYSYNLDNVKFKLIDEVYKHVNSMKTYLSQNLKKEDDSKIVEIDIKMNSVIEYDYEYERTITGHTNWIKTLLLLPDGRIMSGAADFAIRIWDTKNDFKCTHTLTGHTGDVHALNILPDMRIISGSYDGSIKVWDQLDGFKCTHTITAHSSHVHSLIILQNGRIVSGSYDSTMKIWNPLDNFKCIQTINMSIGINCLLLLPDGKILTGFSDGKIKVWDSMNDFTCTNTIPAHTTGVNCLYLTNGKVMSGSRDYTIKIWDPQNDFKWVHTLTGNSSCVYSILVLHDGRVLAGCADSTIKIWDSSSSHKFSHALTGHSGPVQSLILLPDGRFMSGSWDTSIKLWKKKFGKY